jgi:deazaflavin-dependent oxidoreductase (nitroreductase family)
MDMKAVNRRVVEQFRAGGEIEGMHRDRLVLLTTVGRRTGERRTAPMMFYRDADRILVMASNQGAPQDPEWYRNLVADPRVKVELADETFDAAATPLEGKELERQWAAITQAYPFFAHHEKKAGRTIPVVALTRRPAEPAAGRTELKRDRSGR